MKTKLREQKYKTDHVFIYDEEKKPKINKKLVEEQISNGYVKKNKHPDLDLWILNYTNSCQFDFAWNPVTRNCRGLIVDEEFRIQEMPFPKFFNYKPHIERGHDYPDKEPNVYEKEDGSLGILYKAPGGCRISTRGSFESEMAIKATEWIKQKTNDFAKFHESRLTYLFEIIYPENRIVVDYGDEEKLVLLGVVDNFSGDICMAPEMDYKPAEKYDFIETVDRLKAWEDKPIEDIVDHDEENREGFVFYWEDEQGVVEDMAKVKLDTYRELHSLVTQTNKKTVWRNLKKEKDMMEIMEGVPDEFYDKVEEYVHELEKRHNELMVRALKQARKAKKNLSSRKERAKWLQGKIDCSAEKLNVDNCLVFAALDKDWNKLSKLAWKSLEPKGENLFNF